ncbi:MAG: Rpn family recombination-promoting nuclease/putative transposase [Treponema sp.]|jgi:predicted transposase/invertase (TIGR01784 family)|nr:Rpn family recombination-promoting nuclease/putative transposase [Treponema sp.]
MNVNKQFKDSIFSLLFSNPDVLRELYSAIEGVNLPPDIPININTLSDVLIKKQINDISFTIDNRLVVLIEHQSTVNNNMPLRLLLYIARVYEKIIDYRKMYQVKLEKIPSPEFIVLYNGSEPFPDYKELRLSEAFKNVENLRLIEDACFPMDLVVQIYNINQGHNTEILKKCGILYNYSFFIDKIRKYQEQNILLDEAVKSAIKYCIDNDILKGFFKTHSSEVFNMLLTEYDHNVELEVVREEAFEDGLEKGKAEGIEGALLTTARNALAKGIPIDTIQEITGLDMTVIESLRGE